MIITSKHAQEGISQHNHESGVLYYYYTITEKHYFGHSYEEKAGRAVFVLKIGCANVNNDRKISILKYALANKNHGLMDS